MKCQILFSRKNKKNISNCCLLKFSPRMLSVNTGYRYTFKLLLQQFDLGRQCLLRHSFLNLWDKYKNIVSLTLIISLLCDSGSRPEIGKTLTFCFLVDLSANERVIFLWVNDSVEWGLKENTCISKSK